MTKQIINVAQDVCGQDICGPISLEASLACSPIGYQVDPTNGWVFEYGIAQIQLYGPVCSSGQRQLSRWIPNSFQIRFCPYPNQPNTEPNAKAWGSGWTYFGSELVGSNANQYRAKGTLTPSSSSQIVVTVTAEVLSEVDGEKVFVPYFNFTSTMNETARTKQYDNRGYQSSQQYYSVDPSLAGGKGDVEVATITAGVIARIERCNEACGMFDGDSFYGCMFGSVNPTDPTIYPTTFTLGRNANPCGGGTGGVPSQTFCYCDQIILTNTSPVAGTTTFNNSDSGGNGFVQEYGFIGATGEAVGAVQQVQIGNIAGFGQVIVKSINEGALQYGTKLTGETSWTWGGDSQLQANAPTIIKIDRPQATFYIYQFRFPNETILPVCSSAPNLALEGTSSPQVMSHPAQRMAAIRAKKGCGCQATS